VENVLNIRPVGDSNGDCGIESGDSELQNPPQVVITVVRFETDRRQSSVELQRQAARDELWDQLHEGFTHGGIPDKAEARRAQAFKPVGEDNGVEGQHRNDIAQTNLLEMVIKINDVIYLS
jgi:hypothetical protein